MGHLWTAPTTECYEFHTNGSDFDTLIGLYDAVDEVCSGVGIGELACDDDDPDFGLRSRVTWEVEEGHQYIVVVDGYSSWSSGPYDLTIMPCDGGDTGTIDTGTPLDTGEPIDTGEPVDTGTDTGVVDANVLLYDHNSSFHTGSEALDLLGLTYTTSNSTDFVSLLESGDYDIAVLDHPSTDPAGAWEDALVTFVAGGGKVVHGYWRYESMTGLHAAYECTPMADIDTQPIYVWDDTHDVMSSPYTVPDMTEFDDRWGDNGDELQPTGSAYAVAGFSLTEDENRAAVCIGNSGRTIYDGFLWDDFTADENGDGVVDMVALVANEIVYVASAD